MLGRTPQPAALTGLLRDFGPEAGWPRHQCVKCLVASTYPLKNIRVTWDDDICNYIYIYLFIFPTEWKNMENKSHVPNISQPPSSLGLQDMHLWKAVLHFLCHSLLQKSQWLMIGFAKWSTKTGLEFNENVEMFSDSQPLNGANNTASLASHNGYRLIHK